MLKWIFKTCASSCESGYCPKPPKYPLKIWLFRALVDWVSLDQGVLPVGTLESWGVWALRPIQPGSVPRHSGNLYFLY